MTAWLIHFLAGLFEVVWACAMKYSRGFTEWIPAAVTVIGGILSMFLLALAMKRIPLGTAYAVWTGLGMIGTTLGGVLLFRERFGFPHLVCVLLIAVWIVGLKLLTKSV